MFSYSESALHDKLALPFRKELYNSASEVFNMKPFNYYYRNSGLYIDVSPGINTSSSLFSLDNRNEFQNQLRQTFQRFPHLLTAS